MIMDKEHYIALGKWVENNSFLRIPVWVNALSY
jgi:hypothetical protein